MYHLFHANRSFLKLLGASYLKKEHNQKRKTLSETNPHLQDKERAKWFNARSTRSSCGVEGILAKDKPLPFKIDHSHSSAVLVEMKKRLQQKSKL